MTPLTIGDVLVYRLIERHGPWRAPEIMFPSCDKATALAHLKGMEPFLYDAAQNKLVIDYQTFIVRTPRHTILIDSCMGENKGYGPPWDFPVQPWLDGLAATGLGFGDIDFVFCTHLHIDHCGWNTRLVDGRWVPTFANAEYLTVRAELDGLERKRDAGDAQYRALYDDSVLPVIETGQVVMVEPDHEIADGVGLEPSPGHSPGHVSVRMVSDGEQGVAIGDMLHHPIQGIHPDWNSSACEDASMARRTRRAFLERAADDGIKVLPAHFAPAGVERAGEAFRFVF